MGHLYGIQGNDFDFTRKGCWEIYNTITSLITGDLDFFGHNGRVGYAPSYGQTQEAKKIKAEEFLKADDSIAGEYIPIEMLGKMARLNGIVINGIVGEQQVIVR